MIIFEIRFEPLLYEKNNQSQLKPNGSQFRLTTYLLPFSTCTLDCQLVLIMMGLLKNISDIVMIC